MKYRNLELKKIVSDKVTFYDLTECGNRTRSQDYKINLVLRKNNLVLNFSTMHHFNLDNNIV